MENYEQRGGVWVPKGTPITNSVKKSWEDVLYAVRGNALEQWDISELDPYKDNYVIHRAINLLAQNVAQVPLTIYQGERELDDNHPINKLFIKPNEDTSRFELWEQLMIYFYIYGEAFWYLNGDHGIQEIYNLHPNYMKHEVNKQTGKISSWVFNDKIPMPKERVIHFKAPNTKGLRGLSSLKALLLEYGADYHAAKFNQKFFENFAQPGGYLKAPEDSMISVEDMRKIVHEWNTHHKGSSNAHKIGALIGGISYNELGYSQKDMDYSLGRKDIRDRILITLGVNKTVMGISEDVNRANAKEGMRQLWELTLKPQLIRIQEKLNAEFFIPYFPGYLCKFSLSQIEELKKDLNETLKAAKELLLMGYTRNEINKRLSLDMPDSNDKEDLLPMNLISRGQETIKETDKKEINISKLIDNITDKDTHEEGYRRNFLHIQKVLEKQFQSKTKRFFFEQRKEVLKIIYEAKNSHNILNNLSTFFDTENPKLKKVVKPLYNQVMVEGVKLARTTLGKSISKVKDEEDIIVDESILEARLNKIVGINDTIYKQVKIELYEGLNEGETINQISQRVRGVYNFAEKRSVTIARTETGGLLNGTAFNEYKKEGVTKKRWVGGTRPSHAAQNGAVREMGGTFPNGQQYPGDGTCGAKENINCRCAISPVISRD